MIARGNIQPLLLFDRCDSDPDIAQRRQCLFLRWGQGMPIVSRVGRGRAFLLDWLCFGSLRLCVTRKHRHDDAKNDPTTGRSAHHDDLDILDTAAFVSLVGATCFDFQKLHKPWVGIGAGRQRVSQHGGVHLGCLGRTLVCLNC